MSPYLNILCICSENTDTVDTAQTAVVFGNHDVLHGTHILAISEYLP